MENTMGANLPYEISRELSKNLPKITVEKLNSERVVKTKLSVIELLKEVFDRIFSSSKPSFIFTKQQEEQLPEGPIDLSGDEPTKDNKYAEKKAEEIKTYELKEAGYNRVLSNSSRPRMALTPENFALSLNRGWATIFGPKPKEEISAGFDYSEISKLSEKVNEENVQSIEVPTEPTIEVKKEEKQPLEMSVTENTKEPEKEEYKFDEIIAQATNIVNENIEYKKQLENLKKEVIKFKDNNGLLKDEVRTVKLENGSLINQVEKLQLDKQGLERDLQIIASEKEKMQVKFVEDLQAKENEKTSIEEFYKKQYKDKETKLMNYLMATISRGSEQVTPTEEKSKANI